MFDIYLFCDWHQGTSPTGYFYMRFLISQTFCFEMQIQKVFLEYLSQVNVQVFFHA